MNLTFEKEVDGYLIAASPYEWKLGIGVEVVVKKSGNTICLARYLSAQGDDGHASVQTCDPDQLVKKALETFVADRAEVGLDSALKWQAELSSCGHNTISPIFGKLVQCL